MIRLVDELGERRRIVEENRGLVKTLTQQAFLDVRAKALAAADDMQHELTILISFPGSAGRHDGHMPKVVQGVLDELDRQGVPAYRTGTSPTEIHISW